MTSNKNYLKPAALKPRRRKILLWGLVWPPQSIREAYIFVSQSLKKFVIAVDYLAWALCAWPLLCVALEFCFISLITSEKFARYFNVIPKLYHLIQMVLFGGALLMSLTIIILLFVPGIMRRRGRDRSKMLHDLACSPLFLIADFTVIRSMFVLFDCIVVFAFASYSSCKFLEISGWVSHLFATQIAFVYVPIAMLNLIYVCLILYAINQIRIAISNRKNWKTICKLVFACVLLISSIVYLNCMLFV